MSAEHPLPEAGVLVIGEALIDIVDRPGSARVEHVGGSPANVALGLGRLDVPVRLRTALGDDPRGHRIAGHLAASGVEIEPESFSLERTSTAIAHVSPRGDASYDFDIEWLVPHAIRLGAATLVHVGSLGCFLEPGAATVLAFLHEVAGRGRITFDPNIRPALIPDRDAAVRTVDEIAALAAIVKLSDEDAAWLHPGLDADAVLDRLLAKGAEIAAITLGKDGAILASGHARVRIPPRPTRVADTVGAGDTFMATLIASLEHGRPADEEALERMGRRAAVAASITVSRPGADLPTATELDSALG